MKKRLLNTFMVTWLFAFSAIAHSGAVTNITSIFGTGLDGAGNVLAVGADDSHYTVNENSGISAQVLTHSAYIANNASSQWLWQSVSGNPGNIVRTFKTNFDLTGFDLASVVINGSWGADNQGLDILINGASTGINLLGIVVSNFQTLTDFTINSGFVSGINTLEFVIQDNGAPGAFRTELSGAGVSSVPVPAAFWLLGSGLIGFIGMRKKSA